MRAIVDSPECLVVGGGLAGAMAAMRLAGAGREVVMIEKEIVAHHKVCGEFLSPEAVGYLHQAGVDPLALGAATIDRLRVSAGERLIETTLPFQALSLSRSVLDEAMLARAAQQGCAIRRGIAVQGLQYGDRRWVADLGKSGSQCAATAFLATGKHELRGWSRGPGVHGDLVGFKLHWRLQPRRIAALRRTMDLFLFSGGYGGLSLVEGDVANLCLVVRRATLRKVGNWQELLLHLRSENRQIRECLEGAEPVWERPLGISSIPYGYMAERADDMWCIGDQAAVIPSFTGDGMSIALHSGAMAAEMYLAGARATEFHRTLRRQLKRGMSLATLMSRAMVTPMARRWAPAGLAMCPPVLRWIAAATRIPERALVGSIREA